MKILTIESVAELVSKHGIDNYLQDLMQKIKGDFSRWHEFEKIPRPSMQVDGGVVELMPICDDKYYTFKYVNCHPKNPSKGLMTVVATGEIAEVSTGYPVFFSEMTLLTALRTSATTALATDLMSRRDSKVLAIIGTGAQSEFLVRAISLVRNIEEVRYFDIDPQAMDKFEQNQKDRKFKLVRCKDSEEAVDGADIITTCTADRAQAKILKNDWIKEGVHINAIGGDTIGKTELEFEILDRSKIVVEYFDQAFIEGEIQYYTEEEARKNLYAELYELTTGAKVGRVDDKDITLYDSVGIGLEDYSVLTFTRELAEKHNIGLECNLIPGMDNPKNLISLLNK